MNKGCDKCGVNDSKEGDVCEACLSENPEFERPLVVRRLVRHTSFISVSNTTEVIGWGVFDANKRRVFSDAFSKKTAYWICDALNAFK